MPAFFELPGRGLIRTPCGKHSATALQSLIIAWHHAPRRHTNTRTSRAFPAGHGRSTQQSSRARRASATCHRAASLKALPHFSKCKQADRDDAHTSNCSLALQRRHKTTRNHPSPLPNPTPLPTSHSRTLRFARAAFMVQQGVSTWDRGKGFLVFPLSPFHTYRESGVAVAASSG